MFDDADLSRSENGRFIQIGNLPDVFVARRSGRKSDPATKFGKVFPFGFSDWTFLERLIDGLVSHVAPRGWYKV